MRHWMIPALAALFLAGPAAQAGERIFIAGDSTAANYGVDRYPQMGWGMALACNLDGTVGVENRAMGGRSTKSFIAEGRFDAIAKDIAAGDTLLIQFGHNDANQAKEERYTPLPAFRINLLRFISMAREKGAQAVLLTPVAMRKYNPDGSIIDSFPDYADVARTVARETATPLIDLGYDSRVYVQGLGAEPAKAYYLHYGKEAGYARWPDGIADDVHFSEIGARAMASLVAARLKELNLPVSAHVKPLPAANPPTLGWPTCP
ncbi:rhamnogalacturonan acetylesterase [Niveispirillum sp. KHB5.9]|uniref:rhamnogalacturonan acetylesterase n=1 Tax=Niveispirillum sp. KHB5.9 TaxID=3400269 RepID=UPI003A8C8493